MVRLPVMNKVHEDMITRFDGIHERGRQTHRQTEGPSPPPLTYEVIQPRAERKPAKWYNTVLLTVS